MKPLRCIIIEDDQHAVHQLIDYISKMPHLSLEGAYTDPMKGVYGVERSGNLDILFLDINMNVSGLDIAKRVRNFVRYIIFVTGYPEHALSAFDAQGDRFLTKPVSFPKFRKTVNELY